MTTDSDFESAEAFLEEYQAGEVKHSGGTLLSHLRRVRDQLAAWGAPLNLQLAGLTHAAYGTDGFATALMPIDRRDVLTDAIGTEPEQSVYLYGSCTRSSAYPQLDAEAVEFTDRFTGHRRTVQDVELRGFVELTAANDLDLVTYSPTFAARNGETLRALFQRAHHHLTPAAKAAWEGWKPPSR
ncbi:MAG: hypothetical protein L0H22_13450 [Brevibacterium aurantiacum]|nr:hypothetical protein [Brevibacterium aurantiacum]